MPWDPFGLGVLGGVLDVAPRQLAADPRQRRGIFRRPVPVGGAIAEGLPVINVLDYAVADGTDQTIEIRRALDAVPSRGGILYFPPGTYGIGGVEPLRIDNRSSLTLLGTFGCSILQRVPGAPVHDEDRGLDYDDGPGILRIEYCTDLVICGLVFDGNGFVAAAPNQRALVEIFHSTGTRIHRNQALDSQPSETLAERALLPSYEDAHAVAFGFFHDPALGVPEDSQDIEIRDNTLQGLGIGLHHVRRARVEDNRIDGAVGHGIAVGGVIDGEVHEDVEILGNEVTGASVYGIAVADTPPLREEFAPVCEMRRVVVSRNHVQKDIRKPRMRGIVVGSVNRRDPDRVPGPLFAAVEITDNLVELPARSGLRGPDAGLLDLEDGDPDELVGIWVSVTQLIDAVPDELGLERAFLAATDRFEHSSVRGNVVVGARSTRGGTGIVVHNLFRGEVAGNGVYESTNGIHLRAVTYLSYVHDNRVEVAPDVAEPAGTPYEIELSTGGNTFSANAILGGEWPQQVIWRYRPLGPGIGLFLDRALFRDEIDPGVR